MKSLETGTIVGSKVYSIQANIDAGQYSNYFPIIQKMIDSFRITQPIQQATSNMTNATAVGGGGGGGGNMTSSSSATTNATS